VPASAERAVIDSGPKRVAFVVNASPNIARDEWELQIKIAISLVSNARPSDTFLLVLVGAEGDKAAVMSSAQVQEQ
jgi:preprotein translocase subunit SecB